MPPVTQGSRTPLVIWTVVSSFVFVIAIVVAIYFYVDASDARETLETQQRRFRDVVAEAELTSPEITALSEAKQNDPNLNPSMTAMQVALAQRDALAEKIAGAAVADDANSAARATRDANAVIARAAERLKLDEKKLPADNLVAAVQTLTDTLSARQQEVQTLNQQLADTQEQLKKTLTNTEAQIQQLTQTMEQIRAEQQAAIANVTDVTATKDQQVQSIAQDFEQQLTARNEQVQQLQTANAELGDRARQLETELNRVRQRLGEIRIDPSQAVVRQPDGRIIRLAGSDTVFIDIGSADHVTPGLSFEVYDKADGVPPAGTGDADGEGELDQNLPQGKASIEVVRVGATTSEGRVVRQSPGTALSEGDVIANLVYDKNTSYNFLVYGNFDLDRNGVPTVQDAEVIKRLITQWGGKLVNEITVDTDFVVLGNEPQIPAATQEELRDDPVLRARYDAAIAEAEAYDEIRNRAIEYRIPILNQNRFLYLVGYYNQSAR